MASFDETFVGSRDRDSKYRQWSEAAVVIGVNADTLSFDIVVTSKIKSGNDFKILNRTIRNVKTLQGFREGLFAVGDSVLIGYIQEKREHPIILGFGDNVTQRSVEVTLPDGVDPAIIEGDNVFNPAQQPACDLKVTDVNTGSTTVLTIDCGNLDIEGCFRQRIRATCGCGTIDWTTSGSAGLTNGDLSSFGPNETTLKVCPPPNSGGFPGVTAFHHFGWHQCTPSGNNAVAWGEFDCDSDEIMCTQPKQNGPNYNESTCSPCLLSACNAGSGHPDVMPTTQQGPCPQPTLCPADLFDHVICDSRTQAMKDANCAPCGLIEDALITATDQCGNSITIGLKQE